MAGSHSTPPLQTAPIQPHHGDAGYLSPKMLTTTVDLPLPPMRRSPSPMSPSGMGSFVTKAKAMLRGRRSSVQVTASDSFTSTKSASHRIQSHYQTHSARPAPYRQATAPLPSTSKSIRRPMLKRSDGSYSISNPIASNIEANYKYCELIDPADMVARGTRLLGPKRSIVRSPSPSTYSDTDRSSRPGSSSGSVHQLSGAQHGDSQYPTRDTTISKGSRPKSDVFPLSVTESTIRSRSDAMGPKDRVLATFDGYDSHSRETLPDSHAPFEFDYSNPAESRGPKCSSTVHGLGLGISETMMAIRNARMLYPEDATLTDPIRGDMFSDAIDRDQETESNVLAWLGLEACTCPARCANDGGRRDRSDYATDIVDDYLEFGEDASSFSTRIARRPMGITRGLESVTAGGAEFLLTDWRAQLDSNCNFALRSVNARNSVRVMGNDVSPVRSIVGLVEQLHPPNLALPRSRSKTMPSARVPPRPSVWIPPSLLEPLSAPATPSFSSSPYCVASSSRTPSVKTEQSKRRRNTRDMFFESQVSHALKASRSCRRTAQCRLEIIEVDAEEENSADWVVISPKLTRFPRSPGQRKLYVSPPKDGQSSLKQRQAGAGMNKSHSTRSGISKSSSGRIGLSKSPSTNRIGMSKSPSVQSGLAKSKAGPKWRTKRSPSRMQSRSHSKAQLPASSSTRSLPGSSKNQLAAASRPRVRPGKSERRQGLDKENVPAEVQRSEDPNMLRVNSTVCTPVPHCSRIETDVLCSSAKALVAEMVNARRTPAPVVPPRSPARPRTYSRI